MVPVCGLNCIIGSASIHGCKYLVPLVVITRCDDAHTLSYLAAAQTSRCVQLQDSHAKLPWMGGTNQLWLVAQWLQASLRVSSVWIWTDTDFETGTFRLSLQDRLLFPDEPIKFTG